ncbi:MAG: hypothetical protein UHS49_00055 [Faecalimonas sp.]|nr:hypothetical protein [Faecalimonas sp.]
MKKVRKEMNRKTKIIGALLLALVMTVTSIVVPKSIQSDANTTTTPTKMIRLDVESCTAPHTFQVATSLTGSIPYVLSFQANVVGSTFQQAWDAGWLDVQITQDDGTGLYTQYESLKDYCTDVQWDSETMTYSIFFEGPDDMDCGIGFSFSKNREFTMYLANVRLCEQEPELEENIGKNILSNGNNENNMYSWGSEYWYAGNYKWQVRDSSQTEFVYNPNVSDVPTVMYTATLVDYDARTFDSKVTPTKMLHVQSDAVNPDYMGGEAFLGQNMTLEQGETYTVYYQYKYFTDSAVGDGLSVKVRGRQDDLGWSVVDGVTPITKTWLSSDVEGQLTGGHEANEIAETYTFTWEQATDTYFIGFSYYGKVDMYIAAFHVFNSSKENVAVSPAKETLEGWVGSMDATAHAVAFSGTSASFVNGGAEGDKSRKSYTIDLIDYDETLFLPCPDCGKPGPGSDCSCNGTGGRLLGHTLALREDIGVRYYLEFSDEALADTGAYMAFKLQGETIQIPLSELQYDAQNRAYIDVNLSASQMTDRIAAKFVRGDGRSSDSMDSYSVEAYAKEILAGEYPVETKDFAKALLNYGAAAQLHFGNEVANLANAELPMEDQKVEVDKLMFSKYWPSLSDANGLYKGMSLLMQSKTAMRVYLNIQSFDGYTVAVSDVDGTVAHTTGSNTNGCYIEIPNIAASKLDNVYTVTLSQGGAEKMSADFSPLSYGWVLSQNDSAKQSLVDMMDALYEYALAAALYVS